MLAACAPQEQAFKPASTVPAIHAKSFTAADGAELPLRRWMPKGKPKAVIVALHGFNDYSNAFDIPGAYFKRRGIATYAIDQRGFGAAPEIGIWAGEENLARDAADFTRAVAARHPYTPVYLLGESMGGALAMLTVAAHPDLPIKGLVLQAPAVWDMPLVYRAVLWSAAHTMPEHKLTGQGLKIKATDNAALLRKMSADPKIIKATRIDAIYGLVGLMGDAHGSAEYQPPQLLLLHGGKDQVIPRRPVKAVAGRLPPGSDVIYYEEGYHMLTRDLRGDRVLADIARWVLGKRATR